MTLVRWDPFRELMSLQRRLSRATAEDDESSGAWVPPVDVFESGDDLLIRAEIPGVEKDDIEINVENNSLTIRGERKHEKETAEERAYRRERTYGTFLRSFRLPRTVDSARISASYRNGVLELRLPRAEEARAKKIRIEAA
jgi:HSP20 family protein